MNNLEMLKKRQYIYSKIKNIAIFFEKLPVFNVNWYGFPTV